MKNKLLQLIKDNINQAAEPKITVKNEDTDNPTIFVYDVIDDYWGVSAEDLNKTLIGMEGKEVNLRINSPGGDVFAAEAMATFIKQHGNVHAFIDGYAASAATRLASAAKTVQIADQGFYMIHNSWTLAIGNKSEMRNTADLLEKIDNSIIADYAKQTGKSTEEIAAWMDAETWFSADEAVEYGFVNGKITDTSSQEGNQNSKQWDLSAYANAPKPPEPGNTEALRAQSLKQMNQNRLTLLNI